MLDFFKVSATTDGGTKVTIYVEPHIKKLSVTVTIDRVISIQADETNTSFRSVSNADWQDVRFWEDKAHAIARVHSPFWNCKTPA